MLQRNGVLLSEVKRSPSATKFGTRVRYSREALGYTQEDVASLTGLKPSAISHFETGNRLPSYENLRSLVIVLKISADFLLDIPRPPV
jgi:transcriptional regulator with XRE-family HTH domain